MSYWINPPPVLRERALSPAALAHTSIDLLDAGGRPALTVRAVAAALAVAPPSLYSRIAGIDDLLDLALDAALGADDQLSATLEGTCIEAVALALYDHLCAHPWASAVVGARPPRGPHYLRLSERLCVLLDAQGAPNPLGAAYALSNLVLGSATTASAAMQDAEHSIDAAVAPNYARLRAAGLGSPRELLRCALRGVLTVVTATETPVEPQTETPAEATTAPTTAR